MTYDSEILAAFAETIRETEETTFKFSASAIADAIPPLTLKTETGHFVKATESGTWTHEGITRRVFVVVEDPTQ